MDLHISSKVRAKLTSKHGVREEEILECFASREGKYLTDIREDHKTDPPSLWFIAETNYGRKLKIVFIRNKHGEIHIKTAYEANDREIAIYEKYAKKH